MHGLPLEVLREAISKAKAGRMTILKHMIETISEPRAEISKYAPQIEKIKINPDKIGAVIGKGGEMINKITSETGAQVDIRDDGLITVSATDFDKITNALNWIRGLTEEPEVGKIYRGRVASVKDFGAFVTILPGIDGMVHVSQLSDERVENVSDVLSEGDEVDVKLVAIDERGRLSLSIKQINDRS